MKALHRTPIDWHTVTAAAGVPVRHEHVHPCGGMIEIDAGGDRRHAYCTACGRRWTRRDARFVWQRSAP